MDIYITNISQVDVLLWPCYFHHVALLAIVENVLLMLVTSYDDVLPV